jgi:hypothetical protein
MDRTVPDPSLQNTHMGATLDPFASDTWEEVIFKYAYILVMQIAFFHILNLWIIFYSDPIP